jgi:hypothetical protein
VDCLSSCACSSGSGPERGTAAARRSPRRDRRPPAAERRALPGRGRSTPGSIGRNGGTMAGEAAHGANRGVDYSKPAGSERQVPSHRPWPRGHFVTSFVISFVMTKLDHVMEHSPGTGSVHRTDLAPTRAPERRAGFVTTAVAHLRAGSRHQRSISTPHPARRLDHRGERRSSRIHQRGLVVAPSRAVARLRGRADHPPGPRACRTPRTGRACRRRPAAARCPQSPRCRRSDRPLSWRPWSRNGAFMVYLREAWGVADRVRTPGGAERARWRRPLSAGAALRARHSPVSGRCAGAARSGAGPPCRAAPSGCSPRSAARRSSAASRRSSSG